MKRGFALGGLLCAAMWAQTIPPPSQLGSQPYSIRKTWVIGGQGSWDYLTVDPDAHQLLISHGAAVQAVDVETGAVTGTVTGLREAHQVALDDSGDVGYISDGPADQVKVFDRRTFKVVAAIPTAPSPRSLVFEQENKLLFAVSFSLAAEPEPPTLPNGRAHAARAANPATHSAMTVIDAETRTAIATLLLPGRLGFAAAGGDGQVYVNIVDRNQIAQLDASAILSAINDARARAVPVKPPVSGLPASGAPPQSATEVTLDFSGSSAGSASSGAVRIFPLGADCRDPRGLAVDGKHSQLFTACSNMKMDVLNAGNGEMVTSLPIGPGPEAIGYDSAHGMIYVANGGAQGSVTIIRQDVTDTYAVVQTLPTRQRARTLAVNSSTGDVYLVTDLMGVDLARPGGIGTLKPGPAGGSFQVLVVSSSGSPQ